MVATEETHRPIRAHLADCADGRPFRRAESDFVGIVESQHENEHAGADQHANYCPEQLPHEHIPGFDLKVES